MGAGLGRILSQFGFMIRLSRGRERPDEGLLLSPAMIYGREFQLTVQPV